MAQPFSEKDIAAHLAQYHVVDRMPPRDDAEIESRLRRNSQIQVKEFDISDSRFRAYCERIDYEKAYPKYFDEFGKDDNVWDRKRLEHFISFEVLEPRAGGVYLDVAACHSPVSNILKKQFAAARSYRQDLNFPRGVKGDTIGSNADSIPLPDNTVDGITAHNSWEHFEDASDRDFLKESERLLKPGGILCIIPLDLHQQAFQLTSPSVWHGKYSQAPDMPIFDKRVWIVLNEGIKQRLSKNHSPETLLEDIQSMPRLKVAVNIVTNYEKYGFRRYFLTAEKIG